MRIRENACCNSTDFRHKGCNCCYTEHCHNYPIGQCSPKRYSSPTRYSSPKRYRSPVRTSTAKKVSLTNNSSYIETTASKDGGFRYQEINQDRPFNLSRRISGENSTMNATGTTNNIVIEEYYQKAKDFPDSSDGVKKDRKVS